MADRFTDSSKHDSFVGEEGTLLLSPTASLQRPLLDRRACLIGSLSAQPWVFFGRNGAKAETPKSWLIGKDSDAGRDWGQKEKGTTEDEMAGWHHQLDGCEFEWTPGIGDGQGGLACCNSWGCKKKNKNISIVFGYFGSWYPKLFILW